MTAPTQPAPPDQGTRPDRPDAMSIATELWAVVIIGQIVAFIGQYPSLRDAWDRQIRTLPADTPREQVDLLTSNGTLIVVLAIFGVALTVVSAGLVLLTRNGYNWARLIVAAMGVFITVNLVFSLFGDVAPRWVMIPMIISGVAGVGASVLLLRRESEQYCRDMAAHRKRPPQPPQYPQHPQYPPHPQYSQHPHHPQQPQHQPGPPTGGPQWSPSPGDHHRATPQSWPYGDGQHSPPEPQSTRPQSNEGNESRGES
ncbi:hypothetical protein [Gordonia hankookensis]|uniref:Uncharacterized protein n=1 Tax=Gordonia hankookensis TaxID=589403 RepID=A0ABR7W8I2_9ACTN|nr:hypothetical protein [Gordonia hankookensis]MBD1319083.1 hypothetical protein [Gordonia hankookensis]